jgi:hypothetical protein
VSLVVVALKQAFEKFGKPIDSYERHRIAAWVVRRVKELEAEADAKAKAKASRRSAVDPRLPVGDRE